jgi:non-ribosomal peptide synthetase-like protein
LDDGTAPLGLGTIAGLVPLFIVAYCLWIALLKVIWMRRARPGVYRVYSLYYLRHWVADGLMRTSRTLLLPLFTTLYLPPWLRLLGAQLGSHAEVSTVWRFLPEFLVSGDGSFFADGCILGGRRIHRGNFELGVNHVGARSFVGNGAMLPVGSGLGDRCLLGVVSVPPSRNERTPDGSDWLGSPSFRLPNRQVVKGFDEQVTYRPTTGLYLQRAVVDACRILIPAYFALALTTTGIAALILVYESNGLLPMVAALPLAAIAAAALAVATVATLKWVVMREFKPVIVPLWSRYVWLNEMINGVYESIMAPVIVMLAGTPFAAPLLRLIGCRIGRHCYIGTALFSEFDLVEVGDRVALNAGAVIQTHLFEDRIMKSSRLHIGDDCSVGNMAVVLYDARMEQGSELGPLSLVMKGETVPAWSRWHGIPTVRADGLQQVERGSIVSGVLPETTSVTECDQAGVIRTRSRT